VTTKSPVVASPEGTTVVGSLPEDIVREVVERLQPNDILNFSLTVSACCLLGATRWAEN
jgi:hypothetical protein